MGKGVQDIPLKILNAVLNAKLLHDIDFSLQGTCDGVKGYFHQDYVIVKEWS